jgi:hypothetical protein
MKLVFLGTSLSIIYFMRFQRAVRSTYDREQDTFRVAFLLAPCALLALLINQERTPLEVRPRAPLPLRAATAVSMPTTRMSPSFSPEVCRQACRIVGCMRPAMTCPSSAAAARHLRMPDLLAAARNSCCGGQASAHASSAGG